MPSDLDRLYSLLNARTGITRIRDVRLEKIAADRALEARYQVGTTGQTVITHPLQQLLARTAPLRSQSTHAVGENATWHYYPESWVEHIEAAVEATIPDRPDIPPEQRGQKIGWWNSPPHRSNLMNSNYTHWGMGIYWEDVPNGARRWYFITTFTSGLVNLSVRRVLFGPGGHTGVHLSATGQELGLKVVGIGGPGSGANADERRQWPGRGPMYHIANGAFASYWVPESTIAPRCYWEPLAP